MSRVIKDDEEFNRAIQGMVSLTEELEDIDPLADEEDINRKKWMLTRTAQLVQEYSRGKYAEEFPELRKKYEELGWPYQDLSGGPKHIPEQIQPESEQAPENEPQEPQQPVEEKPKKSLGGWLDF
ncbi:hypothetical protein SAMN05661091_4092 [Paenibacillus uliginis N3/975]|uniref:Uncharacterized protein n=1 Tax=Paenibacillus uliginis N3/975 TaxID=1313296 RepID=A0A1X7HK70_9BACL|nr:hypothetical protein [Paenibacillus uliginis]SMF88064.1 hypothetical protein SAMN05661091_4092 [Paenibacillus uliginis N3/975]